MSVMHSPQQQTTILLCQRCKRVCVRGCDSATMHGTQRVSAGSEVTQRQGEDKEEGEDEADENVQTMVLQAVEFMQGVAIKVEVLRWQWPHRR